MDLSMGYVCLAESADFAEFAALVHKLTEIRMTLYDPIAKRYKAFHAESVDSPLCRLIGSSPLGRLRCLTCNHENFTRAARCRRGLCYTCHAGLIDIAIPIFTAGKHVATISCGQILPEPHNEAGLQRFLQRNRALDLAPATVRRSYFKAPYMEKDKIDAVMKLFAFFAEHLCRVSLRLQQVARDGERTEIAHAKQYIVSRLREDLCLDDVARHVHLSSAYFSDLFHRATGTKFTSFVQSVRIREARLLLTKSDLPITQISFDCGFRSLTHFNRVFRKLECCSPRQFRTRASKKTRGNANLDCHSSARKNIGRNINFPLV
ncbi:MAG: PocR ligand-binding domain-containing protein [Verrucomicrobia bacterium]|nr:PocR ligand-binding domain-containing protein [Verrucomicrobiota bacterium]